LPVSLMHLWITWNVSATCSCPASLHFSLVILPPSPPVFSRYAQSFLSLSPSGRSASCTTRSRSSVYVASGPFSVYLYRGQSPFICFVLIWIRIEHRFQAAGCTPAHLIDHVFSPSKYSCLAVERPARSWASWPRLAGSRSWSSSLTSLAPGLIFAPRAPPPCSRFFGFRAFWQCLVVCPVPRGHGREDRLTYRPLAKAALRPLLCQGVFHSSSFFSHRGSSVAVSARRLLGQDGARVDRVFDVGGRLASLRRLVAVFAAAGPSAAHHRTFVAPRRAFSHAPPLRVS